MASDGASNVGLCLERAAEELSKLVAGVKADDGAHCACDGGGAAYADGQQCEAMSAMQTAFGSVPLSELTAAASGFSGSGLERAALTLENLSLHNCLLSAKRPGGERSLDHLPEQPVVDDALNVDLGSPKIAPLTEENLRQHNLLFNSEADDVPTSGSYYIIAESPRHPAAQGAVA
mmetsp:Transcript_41780/g.120693  ORF Transcript_41780/g.120693 Transcript_41780/m.120693 type:complete len:176 (-) Transcript_41780:92-619(-)